MKWKKIFNPFIWFVNFFDYMAWYHMQSELNSARCKHEKKYERYPHESIGYY